jgi:cell division protein FtsW
MKNRLLIIIGVILISLFGLFMIYSSSNIWAEYKYHNAYKYVINQGIFFIIGLILMFLVSKIDYKIYKKYANKIILVCIILLILVLIPGIGSVRNGSRSWFKIGSFGIQPSEFTKIGLIIFTSKYLINNKKIFPIILFTLFIFLLIMLQPDFGTGSVLVISIFGILFIAGMEISFIVKMSSVGIVGVILLIIIAPYRLARILSFLNPWSDPLGSGFQIIQSLYAIGPGGLFGMGVGNSIQKYFYLPEPQTDFIFSIISEEFGFMGALIVVTLFLTIIINGFIISYKSNDLFGKYLSFGIVFSLSFQALLNLMVVVGLVPVTGVTLPFLSYGGSSLLISMISIGIVLNIAKKI